MTFGRFLDSLSKEIVFLQSSDIESFHSWAQCHKTHSLSIKINCMNYEILCSRGYNTLEISCWMDEFSLHSISLTRFQWPHEFIMTHKGEVIFYLWQPLLESRGWQKFECKQFEAGAKFECNLLKKCWWRGEISVHRLWGGQVFGVLPSRVGATFKNSTTPSFTINSDRSLKMFLYHMTQCVSCNRLTLKGFTIEFPPATTFRLV